MSAYSVGCRQHTSTAMTYQAVTLTTQLATTTVSRDSPLGRAGRVNGPRGIQTPRLLPKLLTIPAPCHVL